MEALLLPELTGNVYDFSADNQQQIAVKPRPRRLAGGYLVGQDRAPGWKAIGPWVVKDPASGGEPMAAWRERLGRAGEAMLPASSVACPSADVAGPCKSGEGAGVVWADVHVVRK